MTLKVLVTVFICVMLFPLPGFAVDKTKDIHAGPQVTTYPSFVPWETGKDKGADSTCNKSDIEEVAQRGCCSHHSGVCGCSTDGRAQCCDGALSPSCGC